MEAHTPPPPTAKGPAETFTGAGYHAPRTGSR